MNVRNIIPEIHYVGVNDRVTHLFEALWPIPDGVSYNSYLVRAGKVAIIDGVECGHIEEYLRHVREVCGDREPDYLVVNHMEPDHSGAIPVALATWPSLKVVGNKLTLGMLRGYYGISSERMLEIADGDTIDLDGLTLRFFLTPMVHWPETMMTYVVEKKTLFSGDALGSFGALSGAVIDDEMDVERFKPEIYRYYSNIVGKYGSFVRRALAKLDGVELDYICPTHGPVWHSHIAMVTDIYSRLANYEAEEGVTIVYGSMYGNTAEIAEAFAAELASLGVRRIRVHNASTSQLSDMLADVFRFRGLVIGSPTYSMEIFPPVEQFVRALQTREMTGRQVALFGSYTWAMASLPKLVSMMESMKLPVVGKVEMKQAPTAGVMENVRNVAKLLAEAIR